MIPFANYEPDASPFNPNSTDYAKNVLPVRDGWGPCPCLATQTPALAADPKGGTGTLYPDGSYHTFIGTTTHIYRVADAGTSFEDFSGATYNVPDGDYWSFHNYGTVQLATNLNDGLLERSGSSFASVTGSPPKAKHVFSVGEFVVLGDLENNPAAVQWSGIGDRTQWTIGEDLADIQTFPNGGRVMGGIGTELGGYILQRKAIRKMVAQPGSTYAFSFELVNPTRGCVAPWSIVEAGNTFFYLDDDGFYSGPEGTPIGAERVDRTFFADLDQTNIHLVQGAADPFNKTVWWRYPRSAGGHAILVYDWQLKRWSHIEADVNFIFGTTSAGFTWDDLDSLSSTMDGVPYPLDSRVYQGGLPVFAGIDSDSKFGYFSGAPYEATARTAVVPLTNEDRAFVNEFRIKTDANGAVTARVGVSPRHDSTVSWSSSLSREASTGMVSCRADGRFHQFEVTIPSGSAWTHLHGVTPYTRRRGRR